MKRFFLSAVLFFCVASLTAQVLRTHTIDAKDTLETIAQRYGVLPEDISALNPDIGDILSV
jgi:LysM repeat protein